jgi:hypothetical protein
MKISDLYRQPHAPTDQRMKWTLPDEVYLIGTGASMDVFPRQILKDKYCVLLNDAQACFPELGPVAFSNNLKFLRGCKLPIQCVKGRLKFDPGFERDDNHCPWDDPTKYVFSYRTRKHDGIEHYDDACLFNPADPCHYWNVQDGSVSLFAVQFLCWAGVKLITLVGCDCYEFQDTFADGEEKRRPYVAGKKQREQVVRNYSQYAGGMLKLSRVAKEKFGTEIVSLTPFFGLGYHQQQWEELRGKDS